MLSVTPIALVSVNFGPSITGIGQIGGAGQHRTLGSVRSLSIPWHDLPPNPSLLALLSWHTRVSQFAGRTRELEILQTWAMGPQAVMVKFMVGAGGTGKSRLAAEFAEILKKHGWAAGFVDLRKPSQFLLDRNGTLLIVDYPEENHDGFTELLRDLTNLSLDSKLRLLILTRRGIGDWWDDIRGSNAADIVDIEQIDLGRLDALASHAVYCSALERIATEFETIPPPLSLEALSAWIRQAPVNKRPLFILAAAVHSALHPSDEVVRYSGSEVMCAVVDREIDRLRRIAKGRQAQGSLVFARLLATAAITGEIPLLSVVEMAETPELQLGFAPGADIEEELKAAGLLSDRSVRAPQPDIAAAAFVVRVFSANSRTAPALVWASLQVDVERGLDHFGRLSYDAEIVLGIKDNCISKWLAEAVSGDADKCRILEPFFADKDRALGWLEADVEVNRTLVAETTDDAEKTRLLNNLSTALSEIGDNAGALAAIEECVGILRRLSEVNATKYEPDLAAALGNLSVYLSAAEGRGGELEAIRECMEIMRRLAQVDPMKHGRGLAISLHNLCAALGKVNDNEGALAAILECEQILRRLVEADRTRYERGLARCLHNESVLLGAIGDSPTALKVARNSVEILRRLSDDNPCKYEPDLAMSLDNLSTQLGAVGDFADALNASRESVEIRRRLAAANPVGHEPDLAESLNSLSNRLSDAGDVQGALRMGFECLEVYGRLAEVDPAKYGSHAKRACCNVCLLLRRIAGQEDLGSATGKKIEVPPIKQAGGRLRMASRVKGKATDNQEKSLGDTDADD